MNTKDVLKENIKTTKDEIFAEAVYRCYKEMYANAQPPVDYDVLLEKAKKGEEDKDHPFYSQHYLSQEEYKYIINKYIDSYGLKDNFPDHCDVILKYFDDGNIDTYIERDGDRPGYRGYEHLKSLKELIGEEAYNIVVERVKQAQGFFRFNRDENGFHWAIMNCSPSCNAESVKKYWKEVEGIDIEIVDRSEDELYYRYYCGVDESEEDLVEYEDEYTLSYVDLPEDYKDERDPEELMKMSAYFNDFEHHPEKYEIHE